MIMKHITIKKAFLWAEYYLSSFDFDVNHDILVLLGLWVVKKHLLTHTLRTYVTTATPI